MYRSILAAASVACLSAPALASSYNTLTGEAPLVIAHRGASGYLPEHTLAAYELAIRMGADIVEPDVQSTADGVLVVMHDASLARTTNVADLFAERNGGYDVADFTLAEIKQLTVQPTAPTAGWTHEGYMPSMSDPFAVPTLAEMLEFVRDYNTANGANIGVYPESKIPATTAQNQAIVDTLHEYGFTARDQNSFIQTFDHLAAQEIAAMQDLPGIDNAVATLGYAVEVADGVYGVFDYVNGSASLLSDIAGYADGVGVYIYPVQGTELTGDFIAAAHTLGLAVHGWTFNEADDDAARAELQTYVDMGLDGLFTNYPDIAVEYLAGRSVAQVPLPASLPLLLAGLGFLGLRRMRR